MPGRRKPATISAYITEGGGLQKEETRRTLLTSVCFHLESLAFFFSADSSGRLSSILLERSNRRIVESTNVPEVLLPGRGHCPHYVLRIPQTSALRWLPPKFLVPCHIPQADAPLLCQ